MKNFLSTIIGNVSEKKDYRQNEARAKVLPSEYASMYKDIKSYMFHTLGILTVEPLKVLVTMFEEAAAEGKHVTSIVGTDVAAFADELVRGSETYADQQRAKLNRYNK